MNTNLAGTANRSAETFSSKQDRMMAAAPDPKQQRRMVALAYSASSTLTGPAILGLLIDWAAGTMPWFTVGGVLIGMAGLFVVLLRFAQSGDARK